MKHESCGTDEIFLGNHRGEVPGYLSDFSSIRFGTVAYDIDGNKLSSDYRPLFCDKKEYSEFLATFVKENNMNPLIMSVDRVWNDLENRLIDKCKLPESTVEGLKICYYIGANTICEANNIFDTIVGDRERIQLLEYLQDKLKSEE